MNFPHSSLRGARLTRVSLVLLVSLLVTGRSQAALVTTTASGPATQIYGAGASTLFPSGSFGSLMQLSFTYDNAMLPTQLQPPHAEYYIPPANTVTATASFGGYTFSAPVHFQLHLEHDFNFGINDRTIVGDTAIFFAGNAPFGIMDPPVYFTAYLMFPSGTFTDGSAVLPDKAPSWTYLTLEVADENTAAGAVSLGVPGIGISPVPEPTTYGLFGALALVGLASWQLRRARMTGVQPHFAQSAA